MDYSLHLYGEVRQHLRAVIRECARGGSPRRDFRPRRSGRSSRISSLKEFGLEPVAIFDVEGGHEFLGMPVAADQPSTLTVAYDLMIVATLEQLGDQLVARSIQDGVPSEKLFPLRQEAGRAPQGRRRWFGRRQRTSATARGSRFMAHHRKARVHHRRRRLHRLVPGSAPDRSTTRSSSTTTSIATRSQFAHVDGHPAPAFHQGRRDGLRRRRRRAIDGCHDRHPLRGDRRRLLRRSQRACGRWK